MLKIQIIEQENYLHLIEEFGLTCHNALGAESSYPINEPRNVYEGVEPLPENTPISEPVNHYLDSARRLNHSDESSSDSGSISSKTDESSWNERFQRIYSTANSLEKFLALGKLVKDFVDTAQTYVGRYFV